MLIKIHDPKNVIHKLSILKTHHFLPWPFLGWSLQVCETTRIIFVKLLQSLKYNFFLIKRWLKLIDQWWLIVNQFMDWDYLKKSWCINDVMRNKMLHVNIINNQKRKKTQKLKWFHWAQMSCDLCIKHGIYKFWSQISIHDKHWSMKKREFANKGESLVLLWVVIVEGSPHKQLCK